MIGPKWTGREKHKTVKVMETKTIFQNNVKDPGLQKKKVGGVKNDLNCEI